MLPCDHGGYVFSSIATGYMCINQCFQLQTFSFDRDDLLGTMQIVLPIEQNFSPHCTLNRDPDGY